MDIKKDISKVLSKMVIEFMKNDMAHVWVLKFHKDTVSERQKLIQSFTSKHHVLKLLLDEEHGDVLDNVHLELLEVREGVFDIIFAFLMKN